MRIDSDCIRDILLSVEGQASYSTGMYFRIGYTQYPDLLQKYDSEKLMYHVRYLLLAEYLYHPDDPGASAEWMNFVDLTPRGHEFLNTIRSPAIWSKTKRILEKAGAFSLKIVEATAEGIATAIIKELTGSKTFLMP